MEKRKKSKSTIIICLSLFAAVVCAVAALIFGAADKDNWLKASKNLRAAQGLHETPVFISQTISAEDITRLYVDVNGGKVTVDYYDGEEILIEYYEDYENESVVSIFVGGLTVGRETSYGSFVNYDCNRNKFVCNTGVEWLLYKEYFDITVKLPQGIEFTESILQISGGSMSVNEIVLGKTTMFINGGSMTLSDCVSDIETIGVSGGKARLNNCEIDSINKIDVSGGSVSVLGKTVKNVNRIDVSGGSVSVDGTVSGGTTKINISGGIVRFDCIGVKPNDVSFSVDTSGGGVYFNGSRIYDGHHGSPSEHYTFDVDISGGILYVDTITLLV